MSRQNRYPTAAAIGKESGRTDPVKDGPPQCLLIRAKPDENGQHVVLCDGDTLRLADVRRFFPNAAKLLLRKDNDETFRTAVRGIFKAPKKGWQPYDVFAVSETTQTLTSALPSSAVSKAIKNPIPTNVSDLLPRFNVSSFDEIRNSFRFTASGGFNMEKFIKYRTGAMQVYLKLMLKLGPEVFDLSTLYRISAGEPSICKALMFVVQKHRKCEVCQVEFAAAKMALMHFASIEHGQNCLDNFQEPQFLDAFLLNARDMGFFQSYSNLPPSDCPANDPPIYEVDPDDFDSDDETDESATQDEDESDVSDTDVVMLPPPETDPAPPSNVALANVAVPVEDHFNQLYVPSNVIPPPKPDPQEHSEPDNEAILHRIFKVNNKAELFNLEQFSKNNYTPDHDFMIFRDIIYNIIVNLSDTSLNWLVPNEFSIDKLIYIRNHLRRNESLARELDIGPHWCTDSGKKFHCIAYFEHVLTTHHLSNNSFHHLAVAMKRLIPAGQQFTTFMRPGVLSTKCLNEKMQHLNGFSQLTERQQKEKDCIEHEIENRRLNAIYRKKSIHRRKSIQSNR